jgi:hypothetical protein
MNYRTVNQPALLHRLRTFYDELTWRFLATPSTWRIGRSPAQGGLVFTVISIARSYVVRHIFEVYLGPLRRLPHYKKR